MIPKVIHYCWFGGKPLPQLAIKCIESWKKFLPDYEIKLWNEDNFDINIVPYTKEAYSVKKYAFVSDYARFWILYNYGGLYFDTDVEIIKSFHEILDRGPFMGCESSAKENSTPDTIGVNPGLGLGVNPGLGLYKEILDYYQQLHFIQHDGTLNLTTVVKYTTTVLVKHGLVNTPRIQYVTGVYIYPKEYFCPISTMDGKMELTDKTVSIHHYSNSWHSPFRNYARKIILLIGGAKLKLFLRKFIPSKYLR